MQFETLEKLLPQIFTARHQDTKSSEEKILAWLDANK